MIQYYEFGNNKILTIFSSRFHEKGFKEGYETGKTQGLSEGRLLGVSKGCDIGREVCVNVVLVNTLTASNKPTEKKTRLNDRIQGHLSLY